MFNLAQILSNVKSYCEKFKEVSHLFILSCKDENCVLIGWGIYFRKKVKVSPLEEPIDIPIKRSYCKRCKKTLSFLPPFLLPLKKYGSEIINESFKRCCEGEKIPIICKELSLPEESTLKRWLIPIKKNAKKIKEGVYMFLSQKVHHLREEIIFQSEENQKNRGKSEILLNLYKLLDKLSSILEGLGQIKRSPYHYALLLLYGDGST